MQLLYSGRVQITETADLLTIKIRYRKRWLMLIFLTVWLCCWSFGVLGLASVTFPNGLFKTVGGLVFLLFLLTAWPIGIAYALHSWNRMVFGIEVTEFSNSSVSVGEKILRYKRTQQFDSNKVSQLQVLPTNEPFWFTEKNLWTGGMPSLGFDYSSRTVRFGRGIDEVEAAQLLERIISKFPQYRTVVPSSSPWNQAFRNRV